MPGRSLIATLCALSLISAPAMAQEQELEGPPPEQQDRRGFESAIIPYLALPVLLVLTIIAGLLVGGGDEESESP